MFNNKEKLLFITVAIVFLILIYLSIEKQNCYPVEYQNLSGTHTVEVCEGK